MTPEKRRAVLTAISSGTMGIPEYGKIINEECMNPKCGDCSSCRFLQRSDAFRCPANEQAAHQSKLNRRTMGAAA